MVTPKQYGIMINNGWRSMDIGYVPERDARWIVAKILNGERFLAIDYWKYLERKDDSININ